MDFVCTILVYGDGRGLLLAGERGDSNLEPQSAKGLEETTYSLEASAESPEAGLLLCVL